MTLEVELRDLGRKERESAGEAVTSKEQTGKQKGCTGH